MKKRRYYLIAFLLLILPLWAAFQTLATASRPLSKLVPAGALLYIEAKDFSSLLKDWNASPVKAAWLKTDNYQVFSRSRLFLRLSDAHREFTSAAGLSPDMNFLTQVAGKESVFAWYDIGKLEFLFITRGAQSGSGESLLAQNRSKFEVRTVGDQQFYIRRDPASGRAAAFATSGDYLILATREDLIAGALQLLTGADVRSIDNDAWWARPTAMAGAPGDLRMVLNLEAIVATPYFRSYWVQRNLTDMKQYAAALCDLSRSATEYREDRILLRRNAPDVPRDPAGAQAANELAALVPEDAGLFRAVADPNPAEALSILESKLLAPSMARSEPRESLAPAAVNLNSLGMAGAGDFESRIDQAPLSASATPADDKLRRLLSASGLRAILEVHSTSADSGGVFVRPRSVIALTAASDWRLAEVQSAVTALLKAGLTTGQLGVTWKNNAAGFEELEGLLPMAVAVRGKQVFFSNDAALLARLLGSSKHSTNSEAAAYIAGFSHARESGNFVRLFSVVDRGHQSGTNPVTGADKPVAEAGREPDFLSGNIGSVSQMLAGVTRERITAFDRGETVVQRVVYAWAPQ